MLSGLARRVVPELQALSVSKPDDLDTLMDAVAAPDAWRSDPHHHQGEHLYMSERVVVSPGAGIFAPEESLVAPGTGLLPGTGGRAGAGAGGEGGDEPEVGVGDLVGRVGVAEVRTPFGGRVVRWLAAAGERVQEGQPLVWLRVPGDGLR